MQEDTQLERLSSIISDFRDEIIRIQIFLESTNIEETSPIFDNTTLLDAEINTFEQKQVSFTTDFFKILSISVLLGEYISITNFFEKLNKIEDEIKKLPTYDGVVSSREIAAQLRKISEQIVGISSAITFAIERYKDFYKRIENAYSDNKKELFM